MQTKEDINFELGVWEPEFKIHKPNPIKKEGFMRMAIVGPSESGKSYLLKYLGRKYFRKIYESIFVFCGSNDTLQEYGKILKTDMLFKTYTSGILDMIKMNQKQLEKEGKPMTKVLIIYDDQFTRKNNRDDTIFHSAISGRHDCMSFCMILHDLVLTDRVVKDQFTHLILTRQTSFVIYESVVNQFLLLSAWQSPSIPIEARQSKRKLAQYLIGLLSDTTKGYSVAVILLEEYKKNQDAEFKDFLKKFKAGPIPRN